jgi:predicted adenine nucleotide alpha hydrolase (AANH) superfamily ATPase
MLVHICCSVDSHFFLRKLQDKFPDEHIEAYFFNPNIHPYTEYKLRFIDVQRSCDMLNITLYEGEYNLNEWLEKTKEYQSEPERGKRCSVCFDNRFEQSAIYAKKLGHTSYTSTLLMSPKKSISQLSIEGKKYAKKFEIDFLEIDFRKNGGTNEQFLLAKKDQLYHQNYCGCIYALNIQREMQNKFCGELVCNIGKQIQKGSLDEKLNLYKKRLKYDKKNISYRIQTYNFINYNIQNSYITLNKKHIDSYFLYLSTLCSKRVKAKVESNINNIYYSNRAGVIFISLNKFNKLAKTNYKSTKEIFFNSTTIKKELGVRDKIVGDYNDSSTIIVLDKIELKLNYTIYLDYKLYDDIRLKIIKQNKKRDKYKAKIVL